MTEQQKQPHIVKAILIYSDNIAVELDYREAVRRLGGKGPVNTGSVMFGVLWGGLEALGHMKRKEMNLP